MAVAVPVTAAVAAVGVAVTVALEARESSVVQVSFDGTCAPSTRTRSEHWKRFPSPYQMQVHNGDAF